jgi:hypothetical protein
VLRNHADAIALPQTANKVVVNPGKLEALAFDLQDFGHVAADHPPNVNADFLLLLGRHGGGLLPCRPVTADGGLGFQVVPLVPDILCPAAKPRAFE